jgi:hypothetical protein
MNSKSEFNFTMLTELARGKDYAPLYIWKGFFERCIFLWGIGVLNARLLGFKQK